MNRAELVDRIHCAAVRGGGVNVPRLKTLVAFIRSEWPDLDVKFFEDWVSTDRRIRGTRLCRSGKGRRGFRVEVRDPRTGHPLLLHSSAEAYRTNGEVCQWIMRRLRLGSER